MKKTKKVLVSAVLGTSMCLSALNMGAFSVVAAEETNLDNFNLDGTLPIVKIQKKWNRLQLQL